MAIEIVNRVWDEKEGVGIEVGDYPEAPNMMQIKPITSKCKDWFGTFSVTMSPEFAIELGKSLIEIGESKQKARHD